MSSDQAAAGSGAPESSAPFLSTEPTTTMSETALPPLPAISAAEEEEPILKLLEVQNSEEAPQQSQHPSTTAPSQAPPNAHDYSNQANAQSQVQPPPGQQGQQAQYPLPTSMSSPQSQNSLNATSGQQINQYDHGQQGQLNTGLSMSMGAPSITQYYAEMPGGVSSDGFELVNDGGRLKKDVKRRTKTGCLTCRKRRIKVCKNNCICFVSNNASLSRAKAFCFAHLSRSLFC